MRNFRILSLAALAFCLAVPAHARTVTCRDGTTSKAGRGACSHHGGVASSATETAVTAGTVTCKDGTTSKAGRGACTHHGGISEGPPTATAPPAASAPQAPRATVPTNPGAPKSGE